MKNQTRNLVIVVIVLIILVLGFFVFKNLNVDTKEPPQIPDEEDLPTQLWSFTSGEFKSLEIKNQIDEYTIINTLDGLIVEELIGNRKEDTSYSFIETIYTMEASKVIKEGIEDLEKFGLNSPELTLKMTYEGGEVELIVGDTTPEKTSRYAKISGDEKIYIIGTSSLRPLFFDKFFYLSKKITPLEQEKEYEIISLGLSRKENPENNIVIVENQVDENSPTAAYQSKYRLESPVDHEVKTDVTTEFISTAVNLVAMEIEAINVLDTQLSQYGLFDPRAVVTAEYYQVANSTEESPGVPATESFSYSIGDDNGEGMYYVRELGGRTIFLVAKDAVSFIETSYTDYMSPLLLLPYINDVKEVVVKFENEIKGGKATYNFTHSLLEEGQEGTEEMKTILSVAESGKEIADIDSYKYLYQLFIGIRGEVAASDEVISEMIDAPPAVTLTYKYFDEERDDSVVKLILVDDRNLLVVVNGAAHFTMRSIYIEKLISSMDTVLAGQKLTTSEW